MLGPTLGWILTGLVPFRKLVSSLLSTTCAAWVRVLAVYLALFDFLHSAVDEDATSPTLLPLAMLLIVMTKRTSVGGGNRDSLAFCEKCVVGG